MQRMKLARIVSLCLLTQLVMIPTCEPSAAKTPLSAEAQAEARRKALAPTFSVRHIVLLAGMARTGIKVVNGVCVTEAGKGGTLIYRFSPDLAGRVVAVKMNGLLVAGGARTHLQNKEGAYMDQFLPIHGNGPIQAENTVLLAKPAALVIELDQFKGQ
jgi:hypothetical protein